MRISIGHRLFASVLLAILAVAATGIGLMRQKVMHSFSEYAVNIELDRLDELSGALARRYGERGGWGFVPAGGAAREAWIVDELVRLRDLRVASPVPPVPPAPPARVAAPAPAAAAAAAAPVAAPPVAAPAVPAPAAVPAADAALAAPPAPSASPALPPLPATPAEPPLPPLPPPLLMPAAPAPADDPGIDSLPLQERVTLLDAGGGYLAGRRIGSAPAARREIAIDGRTIGYLAVAKAQRPSDAMAGLFLKQLRASLWIIVGASVALSALAAMLLAAHFRKPIHRLAAGARELAEGRFETRLEVGRSDELGELAHSFNQLAHKLAAAEQSRRQWVADTSHELRTPLSVLRAQLEAIQDGVRSASPEAMATMLRQVLALNKLIDELYALARADVGALDCLPVRLDLWQLVAEQAAAFEQKLAAASLRLELGPAPRSALVLADPDRMRQVLANLLENCIRYTAAGGRVAAHARQDGDTLTITLDDSAPGVPDAALAHLAERFYRVDASRSRAQGGSGLGLALCRRIVEAHGGQLAFAHSPLGGLRVSLTLKLENT